MVQLLIITVYWKLDGVWGAIFFFPGLFFIIFSYYGSFRVVWGLGFGGGGLILGFWGWGFQLMGFGAYGVGPSGFFEFGLSI